MSDNSKWPGDDCPPDCRYSMKTSASAKGVSHRHCGYILYTSKPRGCEPGRGCSRYDNGKKAVQNMPPAGKPTIGPPRWAAPARELWEEGHTKAEIARRLGITWSQVDYRCKMHWQRGEV